MRHGQSIAQPFLFRYSNTMDLERLKFRSQVIQNIRSFFTNKGYLELDTPALSPDLIPETCLEIFKTEYIEPWSGRTRNLYLVPSPEIYIKKIIAQHNISVFQVSKCYRNVESTGRIHSPEFTMLEYYTMDADYKDTAAITEELFDYLLMPSVRAGVDITALQPPFIRLTMDEAFHRYAGFRLSDCQDVSSLAQHARRLGLEDTASSPLHTWNWDDLYELILVHCVEPQLPREKPVFLMDYPAQVPCLARDVPEPDSSPPKWKERWELYAGGIELANCYSEETDPEKIRRYFTREGGEKQNTARVPHKIDTEYWKIFWNFPRCSGNALGVDRLIALLCGVHSIDSVMPFPLT